MIEKLAELISERKLPLVADVRDESAEDVRVVIEPRAKTIDAEMMMESLFRLTELESRFSMNMNVLVDGVVPRVLALHEMLRQWLDHRRAVLVRRSQYRLGQIEHRLEVVAVALAAHVAVHAPQRVQLDVERARGVRGLVAAGGLPPAHGARPMNNLPA